MSKRPSFSSALQKLDSLRAKAVPDERKPTLETRVEKPAPEAAPDARSSNGEERAVTADSSQKERDQSATVSNLDTVNPEQGDELTVSAMDPENGGNCEKRTASRTDTVQGKHKSGSVRPTDRYTPVPNEVLRSGSLFSDPTDFMVYLHMYSYSYGFGRRNASMSQSQLERFTGASKNTIKRSLDRLSKQGWIRLVDDFEPGRVSRSWRVFSVDERGPGRGKKNQSKADSVQVAQRQPRTESGSNSDRATLSKSDTYKERGKETEKKTLSLVSDEERALPEGLKSYFEDLKPERKRRSELGYFQELRSDFSPDDLHESVIWLQENGVPGSGDPCHSPFAFLANGGIRQVLGRVREQREKLVAAADWERRCAEAARKHQEDLEAEEREQQERERTFVAAYPNALDQEEVIARFADDFPMLNRTGPVVRALAISRWWASEGVAQEVRAV